MKKADLIAQLEGAKALTSVVSIDNVIALIQLMEPEVNVEKIVGITAELAEDIANKIERRLDSYSTGLARLDSAEFELSYNNQIELIDVEIDTNEVMEHITATLEEFVIEEDEPETDGFIEAQVEAEQLQRDILAGNEAAQEE
tara:strand:- start:2645 stop:3073 length:429 start_codon:yes stop_codon:yes gene_type:complete